MTARLLVILPLGMLMGGVVLQLLLAGVLSARLKGWLAFLSGVGACIGVLLAWPAVMSNRLLDVNFGFWDGPIQLAYRIDGLGFFFALMGAGIGTAVLLYAVAYMEHERGTTRFYSIMLTFIAGLIHLVYTADLFLVYVSWELVGLCSFLLVGFWYKKPQAAYGARKVLTMTHLAGYGLFAAVVLLYIRSGATLWTDPRTQASLTSGVFALIVIAAMAKSVQFPLHTWIPDAMAAPTPVSALLHAACYVKAGVYLIARLHSMAQWPIAWGLTVAWIGAGTLLIGVLFALAQHDLKRLLAFHTVSQIGYMMLGLGIGTPLGIAAGLFHCLNHGLFKGGLFLCAGAIEHSCGTRDMDRLGGLGTRMPRIMNVWILCSAGIMGIPLLNGFVSKWLLYNAALEAHQPVLALIPWIGSALTVFSFLKATSSVFLGEQKLATEKAHEAPWPMVAGGGVLAAGCVLLGVAPQLVISHLINPLLPAMGRAPVTGVSWFGITAGEGTWLASAGFVIALVSIALGLLAYKVPVLFSRMAVAGGAPSVFTGGEPLSAGSSLGASDFSEIIKRTLDPFYRAFDSDSLWLKLWRTMCKASSAIDRALLAAERAPVLVMVVLASIATFVLWLIPPVAADAIRSLSPPSPSLAPLLVGVGTAALALVMAGSALSNTQRFAVPLLCASALACGGMLVHSSLTRTVALEAATVVALLVIWKASGRREARGAYFAAVAMSAVAIIGSALAVEHGHTHLAMALLLPGMAVKLGLIPLWIWLPLVAESTPAVVVGLVVGVVDVAAFAELFHLRISEPSLFVPALPWLVVGVASMVGGSLLSLAQRNIKRLLAFSTIQDMGVLVTATVLGGELGLRGALLGATVHALAKALLFICVAGPEANGATLVDARGLASRHPIAGAGFVVGALSVLGVPPTLGYSAHWRVFVAAGTRPVLLAVFCAAAMLSVAVYARAIALFWWGEEKPPEKDDASCRSNPRLVAVSVVVLALCLLLIGLMPRLVGGAA